ncbi:unannotated protein [freshwater metagenome]|uniref:Unannotated protein n=1 Tax=freshwater metagenome TaxID=449393 RepID=A0A6J6UNZ7_9ZZZZ
MLAHDAVTSGCRVVWLVAPVMMLMELVTATAAPVRAPASLMLNLSEINAVPSPMVSASANSPNMSRGDFGAPASV